jgi:hypothetical protein
LLKFTRIKTAKFNLFDAITRSALRDLRHPPLIGGNRKRGACEQNRAQDPHILKAPGCACAWRRKLESGEAATAGDIAKAEKVTDRFVSRTMRLAYLSPEVLERLVVRREPPAISVAELIDATYLPWARQTATTLGPKKKSTD